MKLTARAIRDAKAMAGSICGYDYCPDDGSCCQDEE